MIRAAKGGMFTHILESYHIDTAAEAAFTVEQLPALFCFHPGTEADFTDTFTIADFMWIMHNLTPNGDSAGLSVHLPAQRRKLYSRRHQQLLPQYDVIRASRRPFGRGTLPAANQK